MKPDLSSASDSFSVSISSLLLGVQISEILFSNKFSAMLSCITNGLTENYVGSDLQVIDLAEDIYTPFKVLAELCRVSANVLPVSIDLPNFSGVCSSITLVIVFMSDIWP